MVSNKNAYEIRTEILGMAQGFVMDKFHNKHQKWLDSTDRHPETGAILSAGDSHQSILPRMTILREAEKLYSFVDTK